MNSRTLLKVIGASVAATLWLAACTTDSDEFGVVRAASDTPESRAGTGPEDWSPGPKTEVGGKGVNRGGGVDGTVVDQPGVDTNKFKIQ